MRFKSPRNAFCQITIACYQQVDAIMWVDGMKKPTVSGFQNHAVLSVAYVTGDCSAGSMAGLRSNSTKNKLDFDAAIIQYAIRNDGMCIGSIHLVGTAHSRLDIKLGFAYCTTLAAT